MNHTRKLFKAFRFCCMAAVIVLGLVSIIGTGSSDSGSKSSGKGDSVQAEKFMSLHFNEEGKIGEGAYISTFQVVKDECAFEFVENVYYVNACAFGDIAAMGLHGDFNHRNTIDASQEMRSAKTRGAWFDTGENVPKWLPELPAPGEREFTATSRASIQVGSCGNIFYRTMHKSDYYFTDDDKYYLVRFNPKTGERVFTDGAGRDNFVNSQPETSSGYGAVWGVFGGTVYSSACGRYVYGTIRPWSYYAGQHYGAGPHYLFRYDFETGQYRRLGLPGEVNITLVGMTQDSRYLVYRVGGDTKTIDLETEQVTVLQGHPTVSALPRSLFNKSGYLQKAINMDFINVITGERHEIQMPWTNYHLNGGPQVSSDGNHFFFMLQNDATLYVTRNFNSDAPQTEALCQLPADVKEFTIMSTRGQ